MTFAMLDHTHQANCFQGKYKYNSRIDNWIIQASGKKAKVKKDKDRKRKKQEQ